VTLKGSDTAIGIFQVSRQQPRFERAEWGFAIGAPYWGTGVLCDAADAVLAFAFDTLEVHRLEARAAVTNGRGKGALRKVGAVPEAVLRCVPAQWPVVRPVALHDRGRRLATVARSAAADASTNGSVSAKRPMESKLLSTITRFNGGCSLVVPSAAADNSSR
jgi:hypothetical protein